MTAIAQSLAALTLAFVWAQVTNDPEIAFTMWVGAVGIYCWANTEREGEKCYGLQRR